MLTGKESVKSKLGILVHTWMHFLHFFQILIEKYLHCSFSS